MFKRFCIVIILLSFLTFNLTLVGQKTETPNYFPTILESYWVYVDQDGNELTRRAIEGEEIDGKKYKAFSYEPELEDWGEYTHFLRPSLYRVGKTGITLAVGGEVEKAAKTRLKKEMDFFVETMKNQAPPEIGESFDLIINVEVEGEDNLSLLPFPISENEEWDVNKMKAKIKMTPVGIEETDPAEIIFNFTIIETGIVQGTEAVETPAGPFDCLKVEYSTETTVSVIPENTSESMDSPGETVTTVWFAPNVGIVQYHQKMDHIFSELIPDDEGIPKPPAIKPKTLQLKKYEIRKAEAATDQNN